MTKRYIRGMTRPPPISYWQSRAFYPPGCKVRMFDCTFVCVVAHESTVFGNDLFDAKRWAQDGIENAEPGRKYPIKRPEPDQ